MARTKKTDEEKREEQKKRALSYYYRNLEENRRKARERYHKRKSEGKILGKDELKVKIWRMEYYDKNREKILDYNAKRYREKPELREYRKRKAKEWNEAHPGYQRKRKELNPEAWRTYQREYQRRKNGYYDRHPNETPPPFNPRRRSG